MTVREQTETIELNTLSPYACKSFGNGRRVRHEEKCPFRTEFQRDRDRILHCNSFRRLKEKDAGIPLPRRRSLPYTINAHP